MKDFLSEYTIYIVTFLSFINIGFVLLDQIKERKKYKIGIALVSIIILLCTTITSFIDNSENKKHLSNAIQTLINTDSIINKAKENNKLLNTNLKLSYDLTSKASDISENTLKTFNEVTNKDSYCYIDVNSFWYPVKYSKKIIFCLKHQGNYTIENINITIKNNISFCLKHFYKDWAMVERMTTTSINELVCYPNTEKVLPEILLESKLSIPNDSTNFDYVDDKGKTKNEFKNFCNEDNITLQIEIFTPNKTISEIIIIKNYSDLNKRTIKETIMCKGKLLMEINY